MAEPILLFKVGVDPENPHIIVVERQREALRYVNPFTLSGVLHSLLHWAEGMAPMGSVVFRDPFQFPEEHPDGWYVPLANLPLFNSA